MKAIVENKNGNDAVKIDNIPVPEIGINDVLVEVYAGSLNPIDYKGRSGINKFLLSMLNATLPPVYGSDFSGIIVKIGKNVTDFKIGDQVYGRANKSSTGTFVEYFAIDQSEIAIKPKNISFVEAASIPLVGLTSYQALHDILDLKKNDKVLIHAGAGGVGSFAIQLAKAMGAYVATTVSESNVTLAKALGADVVINYRKEKLSDVLHNYDAAYDTVGGKSLEQTYDVLKPGSRIASIAGIPESKFTKKHGFNFFQRFLFSNLRRKLTRKEKAKNITFSFLFMKPSGPQLKIIAEYIEKEKIKPVIDKVFKFENTNDAIQYAFKGHAKGKIVIQIKDETLN